MPAFAFLMLIDPFRMQRLAQLPRWRVSVNPQLPLMRDISAKVLQLTERNPDLLPIIRVGHAIYAVSDYQSAGSYDVLSYLFGEPGMKPQWDFEQRRIRREILMDARRIGWKKLNDRRTQNALDPFLRAANTILGLSVTIAIHKDVKRIFVPPDLRDLHGPLVPDWLLLFSDWKLGAVERLMRLVHFLCLFAGGLTDNRQEVLWFTDEDDIAANNARFDRLLSVASQTIAHYSNQFPVRLLCCTTGPDDEQRRYEDLVAVTDFTAAAVSEFLTRLDRPYESSKSSRTEEKMLRILNWIETTSVPLKRLLVVIHPGRLRVFPPNMFRVALEKEIAAYSSAQLGRSAA